jgi:hypothetical protein
MNAHTKKKGGNTTNKTKDNIQLRRIHWTAPLINPTKSKTTKMMASTFSIIVPYIVVEAQSSCPSQFEMGPNNHFRAGL